MSQARAKRLKTRSRFSCFQYFKMIRQLLGKRPSTSRGCLLALDVGTKHVGVAVSDKLRMKAVPVTVLPRVKAQPPEKNSKVEVVGSKRHRKTSHKVSSEKWKSTKYQRGVNQLPLDHAIITLHPFQAHAARAHREPPTRFWSQDTTGLEDFCLSLQALAAHYGANGNRN
jgi:hypothetical protein